MIEKNITDFLKMKNFAVFGASNNQEHPGYKLVQRMAKRGFKVYPINPRIAKIGSMRCYGNLDELPSVPQVIVTALPPEPTLEVLKTGMAHGVRRYWIQPGSESDSVLNFLSENGLTAVYSECLYNELGRHT